MALRRAKLKKRDDKPVRRPGRPKKEDMVPIGDRTYRVRSDKFQWVIEELKGEDKAKPASWKPVSYHPKMEGALMAVEDMIAKTMMKQFITIEGSLEELHGKICEHMDRFYKRRMMTMYGKVPS